MMAVTHGLCGAALAPRASTLATAFAGGLAAHALGDIVPHRVAPPRLDAALTVAGAIAALAFWGPRSRQFAGYVGGAFPDIGYVPRLFGIRGLPLTLFPAHWRRLHGGASRTWMGEAAVITAALALIIPPAGWRGFTIPPA